MSKPSAREVALDVLTKVERDRSYSNLQLNQSLQAAQLERVDAALATELVYGTIQRLNTLDWILEPYVKKGIEKLELWVRVLFRLSVYQLYYLDRIPDHAVVNEAVELAKAQGHRGVANLVNGVLREVIRSKNARMIPEDLEWLRKISLQHSHPEWLVSRWDKTYG
ncbi:MAG: transcription antitermination factor NusB, partial [Bacilli bacterium]